MGYTINVNGKTYGPASLEQLRELALRGKISPNDHVFDSISNSWIPLGKFPETAGFFEQTTTSQPAAGDITITVKTGGGAVRNISPAQLMEAINNGEIMPNDLIWHPKDQKWLFAGSIASLQPAFEKATKAIVQQEEEYYISVKGIRQGPYGKAQVEDMVRGGHFDADDQVWSAQRRAWVAIAEYEGLAELLPRIEPISTPPIVTTPTPHQLIEPIFRPTLSTGSDIGSTTYESLESIAKPRALWGRRILAAAIDLAILVVLLLISMIIWTLAGFDPLNFRTPKYDFNKAITFYSYAAITIIYLLFRDAGGGSIGKRVTALAVVRKNGFKKADLGTSFLRNIILFVPPVVIVEIIMILVNRKGTRLGDVLAGTILLDSPQADFLQEEALQGA